jgi:cell division protein FtsX
MGNIIIPQDMSQLNNERIQLKRNLDEARNQAQTLNGLSTQIRSAGPAQAIAPLTTDRTPPTELKAVLPLIQQELTHVQQVETAIQDKRNQIQRIQQSARTLMMFTIVGGVVLFLILLLVLLYAVRIL